MSTDILNQSACSKVQWHRLVMLCNGRVFCTTCRLHCFVVCFQSGFCWQLARQFGTDRLAKQRSVFYTLDL